MGRDAGLEQGGDVGRRPAAHAGLHIVGERRRIPIQHRNDAAGERIGRASGSQAVAGRMAGGAVPQAFDQIAAPVPLHRLPRVGLLYARLEVQRAPRGQQGALVVGERHVGRAIGLADRRHAAQVGVQGIGIGPRDTGVFGVGEGRIQQRAVLGLAVVQCLPEVVGGPGADARFFIRRDVRAVHRAEWRGDGRAARQRLAAPAGVAGHAVAGQRQIAAALDQRACIRRGGGARAGVVARTQPIQAAHLHDTRQQHKSQDFLQQFHHGPRISVAPGCRIPRASVATPRFQARRAR
ncbi:hypothetical protein D3C73_747620 [compost metagenome]